MEIRQDYDEENDIVFLHWGGEGTEYSEEYKTHDEQEFVLDFDKKGRIVGIEIFEWMFFKKPLKIRRKPIKELKI